MDEGALIDEVAKLGIALDKAGFRRAFALDPQPAMEGAGIYTSQIPQDLIDSIAELTPAELRVLSKVKVSLEENGVDPALRMYMV